MRTPLHSKGSQKAPKSVMVLVLNDSVVPKVINEF